MKTLHNQKGFGIANLIATLIAFGFVSYFIMQMGVEAKKATIYSNSKNFYEQLDAIKNAILAFQSDQITRNVLIWETFPGFPDLIGDYLPHCEWMDYQAGKCHIVYYTPWGSKIDLSRRTNNIPGKGWVPYSRIVIPLQPNTTAFKFERDVHIATLLKLPFAKLDDAANTITWEVRRVNEEQPHDGLVRRSGDDSTLLGDWDVGGKFAITNAKDVTIRNSDGSQRSLAAGATIMVSKHNDRINKHKCPTGLTPEIITSIKGIFNKSDIDAPLYNVGARRSYAVENVTFWTVKLDYYAYVRGEKQLLHDGEVKVQLICQG